MKILCIGDSLSLPGHGNMYEDVWFKKLKISFPEYDFISFFKRHLTTEVLVNMGGGDGLYPTGADCLEHYMPDKIILQLGIVDCAPRLIDEKKLIWKLIRRMPNVFVEKYILHLKKKPRNPENVKVSVDEFKNNLTNYFNRCQQIGVKQLIYVAIPIPGKKMIDKNKHVRVNVEKYNEVIEKLSNNYDFISVIYPLVESENNSNIYDDGYHPNSVGNELVYNSIMKTLRKTGENNI